MNFNYGDKVKLKIDSQFYPYHLDKTFFYVGPHRFDTSLAVVDDYSNNHLVRRCFKYDSLYLIKKQNHPLTTIFQ